MAATSSRWGRIESPGFSYQLTDDDVLWAARMVQGEGGPRERDPAAILWTMTQLFAPQGQASKYRSGSEFTTFGGLAQLYSQPINPLWFWGVPGSKCSDRPAACTASRESARRARRSMPWSAIPADLRAIVERWATGRLPNPVDRAVEFADSTVTASFVARRSPGSEYVVPRGYADGTGRGSCPRHPCNYFAANRTSKGWTPGLVTITGGGVGPALGLGIIAGALVAAVAAGVYFGRKR